jgi:SAM-dependent methyltransferase
MDLELTTAEIEAFIAEYDGIFGGTLTRVAAYPRVVALSHLSVLVRRLGLEHQEHVGVISGSEWEPEVALLKCAKVTTLNFETRNGEVVHDLDQSWLDEPSREFSLTLCNQVLEHVFNPHVAFRNLIHHTRAGGHLFVSIPTVNCIHSEPYFYSSGFHPRFLSRLGAENGLEVLHVGWWGSYKYLINAVTGLWPTGAELMPGVAREFLHPALANVDGRIKDTSITDCWALFRKPRQPAA